MPQFNFHSGRSRTLSNDSIDLVLQELGKRDGRITVRDLDPADAPEFIHALLTTAEKTWAVEIRGFEKCAGVWIHRVKGRVRRNRSRLPEGSITKGKRGRGPNPRTKYGWENLREGDSKFIPAGTILPTIASNWRQWCKVRGINHVPLMMRTQPDGRVLVLRRFAATPQIAHLPGEDINTGTEGSADIGAMLEQELRAMMRFADSTSAESAAA